MKKLLLLFLFPILFLGCGEGAIVNETVSNYEVFNNPTYGVDFTYPEEWIVEEYDSEAVFQVQVSNMSKPDGYDCTKEYASVIIVSTVRDTENDFDTWVEENTIEGLGGFGGESIKMEYSGYPAYKFEKMYWDTYCPSSGYVIDYSDENNNDRIIEVVVSRNEDYFEGVTFTDEILVNLTFTGYKGY